MNQFATEISRENNLEVITLTDRTNSVRVKIIPELGNNLVSLAIGEGENPLELIWIPTEIKNLQNEERKFFGNPVLFPFPGRIPNGDFSFQNQKYQVPINFSDGTAIHGFVYDSRWELTETSPSSDDEVFITSTYRSSAEIAKYFPFPFQIEMTYRLREYEVEIDFIAKNLGNDPMPFGCGIHPYFRLPGKREDWVLFFPADEFYELINILPTGKTMPIPEKIDFRAEKSLKDIYMDDLFGQIKMNKEKLFTCWIRNLTNNFKLTVVSDNNFEYYVLFAPDWGEFICIEPYTCIPNAMNLANRGIVTGLRTLEPNSMFQASISFQFGS